MRLLLPRTRRTLSRSEWVAADFPLGRIQRGGGVRSLRRVAVAGGRGRRSRRCRWSQIVGRSARASANTDTTNKSLSV
jgi:hypothetical protein